MTFNIYDYFVAAIYVLALLYIGFIYSAKSGSESKGSVEEYLLAGRRLTVPVFVATLVATWYGNILGIGEFVYTSGLVAWVCFGLPYYIAAALFAVFAAGKIRSSNYKTIPEQVSAIYGAKAGWIASFIVLILTLPATYILMLGVLVQLFTGWSLAVSIIFGAAVSLCYLFWGGFKADVLTNAVQFVLMYLGFFVLLFFLIIKFGSPFTLPARLPASHLQPAGTLGWQYIAVWFVISMQTFIDPGFHQRCAAAKSPEVARRGIAISIICWAVFDALTMLAGLYARAYFNVAQPVNAFTVLGEGALPHFWKGLFVVSLLATVMSTLDSYSFISAATIGNDILLPLFKKLRIFTKVSAQTLMRFGLLAVSALGVWLAIALPSAIGLVYKTSSIGVPGLLVPLALCYSDRFRLRQSAAITIMLGSASISAMWTFAAEIAKSYHGNHLAAIFTNIEPMAPGIIFSLIISVYFIFIRKNI